MFDYRKNGKSIRLGLGKDIELAYQKALLIRREIDSVPVITNRRISLDQWYAEWCEKRFPVLSPTTVEGYRYCWAAIPESLKGSILQKITEESIHAALITIDRPSMQGHVAAFLSTLINAAVKAQFLEKSPWHYNDGRQKRVVSILSPDQLFRLIAAATPAAQVGLALAGFLGLRRGEIMGMKAADIDIDGRVVYVRRSRVKVFGKDGQEMVKGTKTDTPRVVPIPEIVIPILSKAVAGKTDSEFLYPTFRNDLHTRLKTACRAAGVPELTLHDLRHICGSNLMMNGGVALAQAVLGHKDITTTVDTYGHLNSVYLASQVNLAHLSDEMLTKFAATAEKLRCHPDPEVQAFARDALQLCHYLSPGTKKGLTFDT